MCLRFGLRSFLRLPSAKTQEFKKQSAVLACNSLSAFFPLSSYLFSSSSFCRILSVISSVLGCLTPKTSENFITDYESCVLHPKYVLEVDCAFCSGQIYESKMTGYLLHWYDKYHNIRHYQQITLVQRLFFHSQTWPAPLDGMPLNGILVLNWLWREWIDLSEILWSLQLRQERSV